MAGGGGGGEAAAAAGVGNEEPADCVLHDAGEAAVG